MKTCVRMLFILVFGLQMAYSGSSYNRLNLSVTVSGHVLIGMGYEHGFNEHHALGFTVYPLVMPGKGFPFALKTLYRYYANGARWQATLGGGFGLIISPPDPQERRWLPMLLLTPGVRYADGNNRYGADIWLAHFLTKTNRNWPLIPIGLEANYGRNF